MLQPNNFMGVHGYMIVYSVGSKASFDMVRIIRDKIVNHIVSEHHTRQHSNLPRRHANSNDRAAWASKTFQS